MKKANQCFAPAIAVIFFCLFFASHLAAQSKSSFSITDNFIPSGYMGDGGMMSLSNVDPTRPDSQSIKVEYVPGASGWGGVFWQYPHDTWCTQPGWDLTGYTKLVVMVRGETGREVIKLKFGHDCEPNKPAMTQRLTKEWQKVTINISGLSLKSITGAFAWIVDSQTNGKNPITFYLDDIILE